MKQHVSWAVGGVICLALGLFGIASPAFSQASPPPSEQAKQVAAMVNKAATEIESKGKASFPEFRKVDSEWFHGDTYLLVYDLQLNTLFDAPYPSLEGLNGVGFHDSAGKAFIEEFAKVAETQGSGWVEYKWPKRGQSQPSDKWVFVKAVTVDGVPGLVGGCFYPE